MTPRSSQPPAALNVTKRPLLYWIFQTLFQMIMRIFYDYKAYGSENVPRRGGVLLASNHESYLDPIIVAMPLRRPISYLARSELFTNWFFGGAILKLGAFPVRQGEGDIGAVKEAIRRLHEGRMLTVYPEGGRTKTGRIAEFQHGFALIVRRAGVPVVPVATHGAYEAWPPHRKLPGLGRVRVMYGKPIDVQGMSAREIVTLLEARIKALVAELEHRSRQNP